MITHVEESIRDSVSVDLDIDHSGAIGNKRKVLSKTMLGLRKRLGFARSGRLGALSARLRIRQVFRSSSCNHHHLPLSLAAA